MGSKIDQAVGKVQGLVSSGGAGGDDFAELTEGFQKFKTGIYDKHPELTEKLKGGQWPKYMIIACADSRVDPGVVLQLKPGDAFIIRNVANMVPAYEQRDFNVGSAVEYAVLHLKVKHIVVLGHRLCGGVKALMTMVPEDENYSTDFIEKWVAIGKPAREAVGKGGKAPDSDEVLKFCEQESVKNSVRNLMTYPFVKEAVSKKTIGVHGGYYDFVAGTFNTWEAKEL